MLNLVDVWKNDVMPFAGLEDEQETVRAAQKGDDAAMIRLIRAYLPLLRGAVQSTIRRTAKDGTTVDDARSDAVFAFYHAVKEADLERYPAFAGFARACVARGMAGTAANSRSLLSVPARTMQKWYAVYWAADGDPAKVGPFLADQEMSMDSFISIWNAMRRGRAIGAEDTNIEEDGVPVGTEADRPESATVEDTLLCEMALASVDEFERRVCRLAYGFDDYDPVPDAEIAYRLSTTRRRVQLARQRALRKMRDALGVLND